MTRYVPKGPQPNAAQREALVLLIEECSEVVQAATKMLRFGLADKYDNGETNIRVLGLEVGDLRQMIQTAFEQAIIMKDDTLDGMRRKKAKLKVYSRHLK